MCCSNVNFKNNILWQNKSINSNTKRRQKHPNFVLLAIVLPVLLTVVLSVLRFTHSDYPFDIFKLLLRHRNICIISGGHGRSNILHLLLPIQLEAINATVVGSIIAHVDVDSIQRAVFDSDLRWVCCFLQEIQFSPPIYLIAVI